MLDGQFRLSMRTGRDYIRTTDAAGWQIPPLAMRETTTMAPFFSLRIPAGRAVARIALSLTLAAAGAVEAKGPKRCDWHGPLSSGEARKKG